MRVAVIAFPVIVVVVMLIVVMIGFDVVVLRLLLANGHAV
jgi:hypothetical protein